MFEMYNNFESKAKERMPSSLKNFFKALYDTFLKIYKNVTGKSLMPEGLASAYGLFINPSELSDFYFQKANDRIISAIESISEGAESATVENARNDISNYGGSNDIKLIWGDKKKGLYHIGYRRGVNTVLNVIDAAFSGNITKYVDGNKTLHIRKGEYEAVLSLDENGNEITWLLTGWKVNMPDEIGKVSAKSDSTQDIPTFSRDELGAGIHSIVTKIDKVNANDSNKTNLFEDEANGEGIEAFDDILFQVDPDYSPNKVGTGYKLFEQDTRDKKLYPLFIGAKEETPMGKWIVAENIPTKGFSKRPGWHIGSSLPDAPWLKGYSAENPKGVFKSKRGKSFKRVWAEVSYPMDIDYQKELDEKGIKDIKDHIPEGGYYRFREANGVWIIAGALKVDRILSEAESEAVFEKAGYDEQKAWESHPSYASRKKHYIEKHGDLLKQLNSTPEATIAREFSSDKNASQRYTFAYFSGMIDAGIYVPSTLLDKYPENEAVIREKSDRVLLMLV